MGANFQGLMAQAGALVQRADIVLSPAQLLTLKANPVQLIPAPGPNKFILVLFTMLKYFPGTIVYTTPASNVLGVYGPVIVFAPITFSINDSILKTASLQFATAIGLALGQNDTSKFENLGIYIANGGGGEYGNGNGSLKVTALYCVIDTSKP